MKVAQSMIGGTVSLMHSTLRVRSIISSTLCYQDDDYVSCNLNYRSLILLVVVIRRKVLVRSSPLQLVARFVTYTHALDNLSAHLSNGIQRTMLRRLWHGTAAAAATVAADASSPQQ